MTRYPTYRESGVEWLGEVPEHWISCRSDEVLWSETNLIDASALNGKTVFHYSIPVVQEIGTGQIEDGSDIESSKLVVTRAQVLVSKLNPRKGTVCIAYPMEDLTVCSSEFVPLIPRSVSLNFVYYTAISDVFRQRLESKVESATKSHQRVLPSDIVRFPWAVPPLPEQTAIAAFLDLETAKIDGLVAQQRRLIDLLREKRQAVISHAVTRGLDPTAPLKPSGIDWLGDVPEGWEVVPLKYLVTFKSGGTPSKENLGYWEGEVPWASARDLKSEVLEDTVLHITEAAVVEGAATVEPAGSVLVLVRGMTLAKAFPVCVAGCDMAINQDLKALWGSSKLRNDFAAWALRGLADESLSRIDEAGHGTKALRMEAWTSMELAVPPVEEQPTIVAFLEVTTAKLDTLTATAFSAIALLQERRAALISAAVTGKIDVRGGHVLQQDQV